jgi:hypothetical protein
MTTIIRSSYNERSQAYVSISIRTCPMPSCVMQIQRRTAYQSSIRADRRMTSLLFMNADQITAYLAATGEAKKWKNEHSKQRKKNKRSQQSPTASSSDDDSEKPEKRQRVELYCFCRGIQYSHTSMECKVMAADKKRFTHAMCNATNSKSPPGGSLRKHGAQPAE